MKNIIASLFALFIVVSVHAQNRDKRNLDPFNRISVGESIEVVIEKGDENAAYVQASGVDVDRVLTEVIGSRLKIHMERGMYFSTDVFVRLVYTDELQGIKVSSSADLRSKNLIKSDELLVQVSSSGDAELEVDVDDLEIDVSSSGKLDIGGTTKSLALEVSSSGKVNGFDLSCGAATADMSSSGRAEITVVNKLVAEASSSGKLTYRGDPDKVIVDASSSGRVRKY